MSCVVCVWARGCRWPRVTVWVKGPVRVCHLVFTHSVCDAVRQNSCTTPADTRSGLVPSRHTRRCHHRLVRLQRSHAAASVSHTSGCSAVCHTRVHDCCLLKTCFYLHAWVYAAGLPKTRRWEHFNFRYSDVGIYRPMLYFKLSKKGILRMQCYLLNTSTLMLMWMLCQCITSIYRWSAEDVFVIIQRSHRSDFSFRWLCECECCRH